MLVLVSVPGPLMTAETEICGATVKLAVTLAGDVPTLKLQAAVPEQAPLHPANTDPGAAVADNDTGLPLLIAVLVHVPDVAPVVDVQFTPPVPVTVPVPVPAPDTVTGNDVGMKSALADCAEFMVTVQTFPTVPAQAPPHPSKTEAAEVGAAVSITAVPLS